MSGVEFGSHLKQLRQANKLSSQTLSKKVGKGVIYVSQLERGLIKNPDYDTCVRLLQELGINQDLIPEILDHFGIVKKDQITLDELIREIEKGHAWEQTFSEEYNKWRVGRVYNSKKRKLHVVNDTIYQRFKMLIDLDLEKAKEVLKNLERVTSEPADFEFFCSLMELRIHCLDELNRIELLKLIGDFVNTNAEELEGND